MPQIQILVKTLLIAASVLSPALVTEARAATALGITVTVGDGGDHDTRHPSHWPHRSGYGPPHYRRDYPPLYYPSEYDPMGYYYSPGYYPPGGWPPPRYPSDFRDQLSERAEMRVINGEPYYLDGGVYYQPWGEGFRVALPPAGTPVDRLPAGYQTHDIGSETLFERAGVWYRWEPARQQYRIVSGPGDSTTVTEPHVAGPPLEALPPDAERVTINGVEYWHYRGHYYLHSWQQGAPVYLEVTP